MKRDVESVRESCDALVNGWSERVTYANMTRWRTIQHGSLLGQLHVAVWMATAPSSDMSCNPNKSESSPNMNMAPLNLIEEITEEARELYLNLMAAYAAPPVGVRRKLVDVLLANSEMCTALEHVRPSLVREAASSFKHWVKRSRIMLNYDVQSMTIHATVCGDCGGSLVVAGDASSDVRCINDECGKIYRKESWIDLLR